jgi:hypothetical protein
MNRKGLVVFPRTVATLALSLVLLVVGGTPAHADALAARIVKPDGAGALNSGGSATAFAMVLPSGAACPGDTAHDGYTVSSYVLRRGLDLESVNFVGGFPAGGTSLVTPDGTPFLAQDTDVNTARVLALPVFGWAPYAHQQQVLPMGTYDVGIACVNARGHADRNWNREVSLTASTRDKGGFTWSVVGASGAPLIGSSSHPSHTGLIIGLVAGAVVLIGGAVFFVVRRRPRSGHTTAQISDAV